MIRGLFASLLLLAAIGAAAVVGGRWILNHPGPLQAKRDVVVPHGTLAHVADALRDAGVIDEPLAFRIAARATRGDGPVHAAEFAFPAGASLAETLHILRTGKPVQHEITIPEGLTASEIAGIVSRADFLAGPLTLPREGSVLPQTYASERGTTRDALIRRMQAAMRQALDRAWRTRDPGTGLRSPHEMLIVASLVERETAIPAERPHVARVFLNRLRLGMRLQSDPTVAYAATGGLGMLGRPISRADLAFENPYNTYVETGLPPSPIAAPGLAAILAVAHPDVDDDLYFVADGSGGHVFAATLEEHLRNVARYRALTATPPPEPAPVPPPPQPAPAPPAAPAR